MRKLELRIRRSGVKDGLLILFQNLQAVAEAAGATLNQAVKINISLTDLGDFAAVNEVMASHLDEPYPARACVQVAALPRGVAIEVEAVLGV